MEQLLEQVESKVDKLAGRLERQSSETQVLREERDKLAEELKKSEGRIAELEKEKEVLTVARAINDGDGDNSKVVRGKINELVREIDKCIALLNR